jgi:hypothetical protein
MGPPAVRIEDYRMLHALWPLCGLARRHLLMREAADPRIEAAAIGDAEYHRDFVGHRRIRQHDRHPVVVRAHVDVVLVIHGNIDTGAGRGLLGEG